jgi:chromosome segregation ATPase
MPGSMTTFTFMATSPPSSLLVTPTLDQQTYAPGVTFTGGAHSCTSESAAVTRLKTKIAKLEKKLKSATGTKKASYEKQLASLEKHLTSAESAVTACEK